MALDMARARSAFLRCRYPRQTPHVDIPLIPLLQDQDLDLAFAYAWPRSLDNPCKMPKYLMALCTGRWPAKDQRE